MKDYGMFCEVFGKTNRNLVIEHMLINKALEFAIPDMALELGISKPKAYNFTEEFIKLGYIIASRKVGSVQLYQLNTSNAKVQILLRAFSDCLKLVIEQHSIIEQKFDKHIVVWQNRQFELVELTDKKLKEMRETYHRNEKALAEQRKK